MVSKIIDICVLYHLSNNYSFSFVAIHEVFNRHFDKIKSLFYLFFLFAVFTLPCKLLIISMNSVFKIAFRHLHPASNIAQALIFSSYNRFMNIKLSINLLKLRDADLAESVDWVESWSRILQNEAASSATLHGFVIWSCIASCTLLKIFADLAFVRLRSWSKILSAFTVFDIFDWLSLKPIKFLNRCFEFAAYFYK